MGAASRADPHLTPGRCSLLPTRLGGILLTCVGARLASLLGLALAFFPGCRAKVPVIDAPFTDDFERAELGGLLERDLGPLPDRGRKADRLERPQPSSLAAPQAASRRRRSRSMRCPRAQPATSSSSCSATANRSIPTRAATPRSGYVLIFGGWGNSLSVICRQDEHGDGRKAAARRHPRRAGPQLPLHDHAARRRARLGDRRPPVPRVDRSRAAGRLRARVPGRRRLGGRADVRQPHDPTRPLNAAMDEPPSPTFDLDHALATLAGRTSLLIYTHDNPDPDALAAALGLQRLARARARRRRDAHATAASSDARRTARWSRTSRCRSRPSSVSTSTSVRHHRAGRQPAGDRQQLAAPRPPHRHRHRSPPAAARQRARRVVRHPP